MAAYQSVVNINNIMKFLIAHKAFISQYTVPLCTTLPYRVLSIMFIKSLILNIKLISIYHSVLNDNLNARNFRHKSKNECYNQYLFITRADIFCSFKINITSQLTLVYCRYSGDVLTLLYVLLRQGSSTRGPRAACGPRASFVWPGKGISQNTIIYEY